MKKCLEVYAERKREQDIAQAYISASFHVRNFEEFKTLQSAYIDDLGKEFDELLKEVKRNENTQTTQLETA